MPGKPKVEWSLEDRFDNGDRSMIVEPLDWLILQVLPPEGTLAGGMYPVGETVPGVVKKLGGGPVTVPIVSSRVRILAVVGLAVRKKAVGSAKGLVWQITKKGEEAVKLWTQQQQP